MIRPHPETDAMTTAEIRAAIAEADEKLKLANEIPDEQAAAWFSQELPSDFKTIRKTTQQMAYMQALSSLQSKSPSQQVGGFYFVQA
jgi:hypothetical protein